MRTFSPFTDLIVYFILFADDVAIVEHNISVHIKIPIGFVKSFLEKSALGTLGRYLVLIFIIWIRHGTVYGYNVPLCKDLFLLQIIETRNLLQQEYFNI